MNTYVAFGVTVARIKLEQSALREEIGGRPSRVPVTARAQLSALQPLVRSITLAMAAAAKDRTIEAFIFSILDENPLYKMVERLELRSVEVDDDWPTQEYRERDKTKAGERHTATI